MCVIIGVCVYVCKVDLPILQPLQGSNTVVQRLTVDVCGSTCPYF